MSDVGPVTRLIEAAKALDRAIGPDDDCDFDDDPEPTWIALRDALAACEGIEEIEERGFYIPTYGFIVATEHELSDHHRFHATTRWTGSTSGAHE